MIAPDAAASAAASAAAAGDLVVHLARLAGALREAGVRVALGDEIDALAALVRIDLADPDEVRRALRCTLRIRPPDLAAFERAFAATWLGREPERPPPPAARRQGPGLPLPAALAGLRAALAGDAGAEVPDGDQPGASAQALFRRKPFERCDDRDLAAMEPVLDRLARRLATRRSRRWVPVHGRGRTDVRRSLRRALGTGGELVALAHRARPVETARLVLLCDTSGSMEAHTRFLLAFARALRRVADRTEVFAFNTELVRITSWMSVRKLSALEARLRAAVPDWSGGTRIGECLAAFAARHLAALVDSRTAVVVLSDGLERGDPVVLGEALRRIRARAGRVLWLNPLAGDPGYQPTAAGMAAALPHLDLLAPAHDLASLEALLPHLRT
ncbi:MAG TPA: VWA domain-containing protein [Kofleriaceae bacterium]|nr:VWA domain-containing protein [Kofleriaceae bacterium]